MRRPTDPRAIVKSGYDQAAAAYAAARPREPEAQRLLSRLLAGLPPGAKVLDAGCGAGVPVARALAKEHEVLGIDISPVQVALARKNVPEATFEVGDLSALELPDSAFDGIVCYYAIIHVPRADHGHVLACFHRVLKPGGLLLVCMGNGDLPGAIEDDFFGARMYWSHFDRATNLGVVEGAGFEVIGDQEVPDARSPAGRERPGRPRASVRREDAVALLHRPAYNAVSNSRRARCHPIRHGTRDETPAHLPEPRPPRAGGA